MDKLLLELFAALIGVDLLATWSPARYLQFYTNNSMIIEWISRSRLPNLYVCELVVAIDRSKYQYLLTLVRYILSAYNVSADLLCRNTIPFHI